MSKTGNFKYAAFAIAAAFVLASIICPIVSAGVGHLYLPLMLNVASGLGVAPFYGKLAADVMGFGLATLTGMALFLSSYTIGIEIENKFETPKPALAY